MTYRGRIKNGVVVFEEPVPLPDGAEVEVIPSDACKDGVTEEEIPSLYERLKPIIGAAQGLPPDASINLDHYLYGTPKE